VTILGPKANHDYPRIDYDISLTEIKRFINDSEKVRYLYGKAMDIGFWEDSPDHRIENFAAYLQKSGINNLNEIEGIIDRSDTELIEYLKRIYSTRTLPWRVSTPFLCELLLTREFPSMFDFDFLTAHGFDHDRAKAVLSVLKKPNT